jgi:bifunctional non-homologous end joining protein LigD
MHGQYSDHIVGNGPVFFQQACKLGSEGIMSSPNAQCRPGDRGGFWLKAKCLNREAFIVVGWPIRREAGRAGTGHVRA